MSVWLGEDETHAGPGRKAILEEIMANETTIVSLQRSKLHLA